MKHPLNDKICREITAHMDFYNPTVLRNDMRTAADWQLEQVIRWLYDNLDEYSTNADPRFFLPMWRLISDLELAMRPTQ